MSTILLSIKPEYSNKILDGTKKFEYRRRLPKQKVTKIIIYSTSPIMQIVGDVDVVEVLNGQPLELYRRTKGYRGINAEKYLEYFKNSSIAYAYKLGDVRKFEPPKTLKNYGMEKAPQSFSYIKESLK